LAANQNHGLGQHYLGRLYAIGSVSGSPDLVKAYLWYDLAASNGRSLAARNKEQDIASKMSPAQIAEAEQLVAEWRPKLE